MISVLYRALNLLCFAKTNFDGTYDVYEQIDSEKVIAKDVPYYNFVFLTE